jgi:hypothetical protein
MDPITTAIVAAVAAGAAEGIGKVGGQALIDAYNKLKKLLTTKYGSKSEVIRAVKALEAKPNSSARRDLLKEEIASAKADQDHELIQATQILLKILKINSDEYQIIQMAIGDKNIQTIGDDNIIKVNNR